MRLLLLILLLPAAGAALNGLLGVRWFGRRVSGGLACAAMGMSFALAVWACARLVALPVASRLYEVVLGDWITPIPLATSVGIGTFQVSWLLRLDPLSAIMLLAVTGVGFLTHVYSTVYMNDEPRGGYARFFCYLNLFCAFMLVLVLGGNFPVMFVGWEGVGFFSYLLIGFWYEKVSAAAAGKKAFIVNRIGDWGFLVGIFLVFFTFGTLDFREVASASAAMPRETGGFGPLSWICLLLFVGAAGKSAQIPLFVWLPDAMEGPTPVSALIHAATMVTAGVYVVARNAVLFEHAPVVMQIVAIVGAATACVAAAIGIVQNDIKRVLAYSTVSQLGYMFVATGVGAFGAAVFHLVTHAVFKALLFLGSGSVIHATAGEQDMRRMGGLRRYMPVTFLTMMIGALSLAGVPPLAGFFSKDLILYRAFGANRIVWGVAAVTALLTAVYTFRLMALTFYGAYRGPGWTAFSSAAAAAQAAEHGAGQPFDAHAHGQADRLEHEITHGPAAVVSRPASGSQESGAVRAIGPDRRRETPLGMTGPLVVLAAAAVVAALVAVPRSRGGTSVIEEFLEPSFTAVAPVQPDVAPGSGSVREPADAAADAHLPLMLVAVLTVLGGALAVRHLYIARPEMPERMVSAWPRTHALLFGALYVDDAYRATVVRATAATGRGLYAFDTRILDRAVDGSGSLTLIASWISHMLDKYVMDGFAGLAASGAGRASFFIRRVQTGLVQNYALLMIFGLFALLTAYLLATS
jgi:NADH-quinone oxidoreductase subunit L